MKEIELEIVGAADNLLLGYRRLAPRAAERPVNEVWHARIFSQGCGRNRTWYTASDVLLGKACAFVSPKLCDEVHR